ncbi:nucleolin-like [Ornithodoros turicata]|uniref:nucleolin-like n=1 Tax=Ornithodoros turicata TaxID=34597 RepID=UPI0031396A7A
MVRRKSQGGSKTQRGALKPIPKKNAAQEVIEFDDDEDLEFEDDSELDEDKELDEEESLDEEEDEDLDEEEAEEEVASSPNTKQKVSPPKVKQEGPQKTRTKRKAVGNTPSRAKRVKLEDYIPASQVLDYNERDTRTLCLKNFHTSVKFEDVEKVCRGAVEMRGRRKSPLSVLFVTYPTPQDANAAVKKLQKFKLKGKALEVECCAAVHKEGGPQRRRGGRNIRALNVHNIPKATSRSELRALFPGLKVAKWLPKFGWARLRFESISDLKSAIENPQCHQIGGTKLMFAFRFKKQTQVQGKRQLKTVAKEVPTPLTGKKVATAPASEGKRRLQGKRPNKQGAVAKSASSSNSPKTFQPVGTTKSPLPKQKFQTPRQSPKGAPKGRKSTGKKQKA